MTTETTAPSALGVGTVLASHTWIRCGGFWKQSGLAVGDIPILVAHVNVGYCWDYHKASGGAVYGPPQWGPRCYVSTSVYTVDKDWCGIWNNNHWHTEPGRDFSASPWLSPWIRLYCYVRYVVRGDGASSAMWGDCE